jgi:hypothetical protein
MKTEIAHQTIFDYCKAPFSGIRFAIHPATTGIHEKA